jgi:hypothetical protein
VALSASLGALLFAHFAGDRRLVRRAFAVTAVLAVLVAGHTWLVHRGEPWLRLTWIKGVREPRPLYERWNSFSYIRVRGDPRRSAPPVGWGLSPAYPPDRTVGELFLDIDASAMTILTRADGRPGALMHLTHNVTSLAHYVRRDARVLIVGSGCGRDVLTALAFDQRSVLALEINQDILATVNGRFGAFTGPLDRDPRVTFVNDEARSWLARSRAEFDIIQASLVDTWAATAAGAFVLTEHALYTLEAFDVFLDRLAPDGILTMTRWYFRDAPGVTYRLTALAQAALRRRGVADPRRHLVVARKLGERPGDRDAPEGLGTLLVGKRPFSPEEVGVIQRVTRALGFELMLAPSSAADPVLATLAGAGADAVIAGSPLDISPPTDDRPFFFHMLRLRDVLRGGLWGHGLMTSNPSAVEALGVLLLVVVTLTALAIVVPLLLTTGTGALRGGGLPVLFFAGIGLGFMLVEVSQMQRLIIFLGHPTYGLSVVLFALLLAGGLGSYWTEARGAPLGPRGAAARLGGLLLVLGVFGAATPAVIAAFQAATTSLRIAVAVAMLLPVGFCLGTALPLGLGLASRRWASLTPWLWGINGATSVCASVLAVAISMTAGIAAAFWTGFGCYVVATLAYLGAARHAGPLPGGPLPGEGEGAPTLSTAAAPEPLVSTPARPGAARAPASRPSR